MAAPQRMARNTPTGSKLLNGFPTKVTFSLSPQIDLWEKSVKPPGVDIGELIDVSDMFNSKFHTGAFRALQKITSGEHKCAYHPNSYARIKEIIGVNGTVTVTFPDTSALAFFGGIKSFQPDALEEGKQPEATVVFEATNLDPTDQSEHGPVLYPAFGTGT